MLNLLVATSNPGKLRDFALMAGGEFRIAPLPGLNMIPAPEEDQETFEGNARLKAVFYSQFAPGEIVVADDSGLEVDALGGAPGVRSARYAEDASYLVDSGLPTDERNNRCLVAALDGVTLDGRSARYRCVLVAAKDARVISMGEGMVRGLIRTEGCGIGGFGYDPYFVLEGLCASMAELEPDARFGLSHRGRAFRDLLAKLEVECRL